MAQKLSRSDRTDRRDENIRKKFFKLRNKKYKNTTQFYSDATIFEMLSEHYGIAPATVEAIVFFRVKRIRK